MATVPNQRIIKIHRKKYKTNFLQIGNEEWQEAYRKLTPSAFQIYLYLASNCNNFQLGLSQKAVEDQFGIKKTAYHTAINQLEELGYIRLIQGNIYEFNDDAKTVKMETMGGIGNVGEGW